MKINRRWGRRGLAFQDLEPRLAFDADGVVADGDVEVVGTAIVDVELTEIEALAYQSGVPFGGLPPSDDLLPVSDELHVEELDEYMLRNFTTGGPTYSLDTDGDGVVAPRDALIVINALNEQMRGSVTLEARAINTRLDVNLDGIISPLDALLVINGLNHHQRLDAQNLAESGDISTIFSDGAPDTGIEEPVEGLAKIDMDSVLESLGDDAKQLALADVGTYAVVVLRLDAEGVLTAEADSVAVDCVVGEDGSIAIGDLLLPAHVVKTDSGRIGLLPGYIQDTSEAGFADDGGLMQTRMAGATIMTVAGVGEYGPIVLSFSEDGGVLANAGGDILEATLDEKNVLSIAGIAVPVAVVTLADTRVFVPMELDASGTFTIAWPSAVDDAMASW